MTPLSLLLACTSPPATESEPADSAWPEVHLQNPEGLQPSWTASQAGPAFQAALQGPFPSVRAVAETYLDWIALGDESCPGGESLQPPAVSLEGCTSASGVHYAGLSAWSEDSERWGLHVGDFRITHPGGAASWPAARPSS